MAMTSVVASVAKAGRDRWAVARSRLSVVVFGRSGQLPPSIVILLLCMWCF
jgi:hypothetical protein